MTHIPGVSDAAMNLINSIPGVGFFVPASIRRLGSALMVIELNPTWVSTRCSAVCDLAVMLSPTIAIDAGNFLGSGLGLEFEFPAGAASAPPARRVREVHAASVDAEAANKNVRRLINTAPSL